jgi:hypothetical protein
VIPAVTLELKKYIKLRKDTCNLACLATPYVNYLTRGFNTRHKDLSHDSDSWNLYDASRRQRRIMTNRRLVLLRKRRNISNGESVPQERRSGGGWCEKESVVDEVADSLCIQSIPRHLLTRSDIF